MDFSIDERNWFTFLIFRRHLRLITVKKAYYRLSLQVHPDRVAEADKEEATEKFKILTKINSVLSDPNKKAIYDEQGIIDDEGDSDTTNWLQLWRQFFKPITTTDIEKFQKEYTGMLSPLRSMKLRCFSNFGFFVLVFRIRDRGTWYSEVIFSRQRMHKLYDGLYSIHDRRRWTSDNGHR